MKRTPNQLLLRDCQVVIANNKGQATLSARTSLTCPGDVNVNKLLNEVT